MLRKLLPAAAVFAALISAVYAQDSQKSDEGRILYHEQATKYCVGGVSCEKYCSVAARNCRAEKALTVELPEPARVTVVQVTAHDNIGANRHAMLRMKVNGAMIGTALVYRAGSTVSIRANKTGQVITIESMHALNGFRKGGEESVISDIYIFGTPLPVDLNPTSGIARPPRTNSGEVTTPPRAVVAPVPAGIDAQ